MAFSENRVEETEALRADGSIDKMKEYISEVKAGQRKFYVYSSLGKDKELKWWPAEVIINDRNNDHPLGWSERDPGIVNVKIVYVYGRHSANSDPAFHTGTFWYKTTVLLRDFLTQQFLHDTISKLKSKP